MKITHYLYNTFRIESGNEKIAIDPDHYWDADRLAKASGAPLACNKTMLREVSGKRSSKL